MSDAVDTNAWGWLDVLALQPGAEVHDGWVITDVPFSLCNSVVMPRFDEAGADERIDTILAAGRARGVPQLWWTGESCTPADLVDRLEARGVVHDLEPMPAMTLGLDRLPPEAPAPSGLRIEPVIDAAGLAAFAEPFGSAFGFPADGLASVVAAFADFAASGTRDEVEVHHWVGFEGDRPVAAASVLVRDGVAGLYNVATVIDARGRGYGAALSVAALRGGAAAGAHTAILHASPSGLPIYERLGFATVGTVRAVETRAAP